MELCRVGAEWQKMMVERTLSQEQCRADCGICLYPVEKTKLGIKKNALCNIQQCGRSMILEAGRPGLRVCSSLRAR